MKKRRRRVKMNNHLKLIRNLSMKNHWKKTKRISNLKRKSNH